MVLDNFMYYNIKHITTNLFRYLLGLLDTSATTIRVRCLDQTQELPTVTSWKEDAPKRIVGGGSFDYT